MQAFSACFMKFCLALNNYKKRIIPSKTEKESAQLFQKRIDKTKKERLYNPPGGLYGFFQFDKLTTIVKPVSK